MNLIPKYHVTREEIEAEALEIDLAKENSSKFEPLYNRYYARVLSFVFQRIHSRDDAYDITQQVFIAALENISKYRSQGVPFSAWLFRIALNELSYSYRRSKVRQAINIDDVHVSEILGELQQENTAATDAVLMQIIEKLNPEEVTLLELRFFEQRPFKEISQILNIREAAAKARIYRLLERMKVLFTALT